MPKWKSTGNVFTALVVAALAAGDYQAIGAPTTRSDGAWGFEMWCLEMQLYPTKRCDLRTPEDLREYDQYRADVEKYRQQQQGKLQRDQEMLQRQNQNLPGSPGPIGR